ncbi:unannotated protein [freshwater metagenome]|uniref:Unannotated protein n=1 Tax=freshwater metagenome TaxID=449393 RepID=A0A6J7ERW4_9ZZZZ
MPPEAASVTLYDVPTAPLASDAVVTVTGAAIVMERDFVATSDAESVILMLKLEVPAAVGLPPISPVDGFSKSPAGSDPLLTLHAYGVVPADPASVWLYAAPTVPTASEAVVMVGLLTGRSVQRNAVPSASTAWL